MNRVDQAVYYFADNKSVNCSQAVLAAYSEEFGLGADKAFSVAAGFGGGMRMAGVCGAVTGAYMVLGLKNGAAGPEDGDKKDNTYKMVEEFTKRFEKRNDSVVCMNILGCDISTKEGLEIAVKNNLFNTVCVKMVKDAAEILEEMLFTD